jgi:hypothetical protein
MTRFLFATMLAGGLIFPSSTPPVTGAAAAPAVGRVVGNIDGISQGAGFYKMVTADNSRACPNAAQYYGKLVNGVDRMVLVGADRFVANAAITGLETGARPVASSGPFSTDAVLFGKWRD